MQVRDSMISRKVEIPHDVIPASSKQCGSWREVSPGRGELIPWQHILPFNLLLVFCSFETKSIVIQWDPEDFYLIHWIQQNSVKPNFECLWVKERGKEALKIYACSILSFSKADTRDTCIYRKVILQGRQTVAVKPTVNHNNSLFS